MQTFSIWKSIEMEEGVRIEVSLGIQARSRMLFGAVAVFGVAFSLVAPIAGLFAAAVSVLGCLAWMAFSVLGIGVLLFRIGLGAWGKEVIKVKSGVLDISFSAPLYFKSRQFEVSQIKLLKVLDEIDPSIPHASGFTGIGIDVLPELKGVILLSTAASKEYSVGIGLSALAAKQVCNELEAALY